MEQTARISLGLAAGLALALTAGPASAQAVAPITSDKSEVILGATSRLAEILAAQASGTTLAVAPALATTVAVAQPTLLFTLFTPHREAPDLAASPNRPDIFNSIAMPIARTSLDDRWARVGTASIGGHAGRFAMALRSRDERARLDAVNAYVNARVAFVDDVRRFGVADRWSAASETLSRGRGDCEDYALAKLAMLRRAGFAEHDLYFVVLKDLSRRADHAVLVVRSGGRFLVLDNGTNRLLDSAEVRDYRPILTFSAGQRFTHGYRRAPAPPVIMAAATTDYAQNARRITTSAGMPSSPFASR